MYLRNPRPTQEWIKRHYDEDYPDLQQREERREERRVQLERQLTYLLQVLGPQRGRLLDVGCGNGDFMVVARDAGFSCCGTEISEVGADLSREHGFDVSIGQLEDLYTDLSAQPFDVVTMWHSLEHVPVPGDALKAAFGLLKPGGTLMVAVPNEDNGLLRMRMGLRSVEKVFPPMATAHEIHLTSFQPATLRRTLAHTGFRILRFGVHDIYGRRSMRNLLVLSLQRAICGLTNWHFSMAMYAVARKPA